MKIAILGCSGSGKSTLASSLSRSFGIPHIELDSFFHLTNWSQPTPEAFKVQISEQLRGHDESGWVIDGNYQSKLGNLVVESADVIIWFNLPRNLVTYRVVKRTIIRTVLRKELWNGNKEKFRNLFKFDPHLNIILWTWTQHGNYKDWGLSAREIYAREKLWLEVRNSSDIKQIESTLRTK